MTPSRSVALEHQPADDQSVTLVAESVEQQFTEFYEGARPRLLGALAVSLGDRDLAAEATDEAMARAFQRWNRVSTLSNPAGWVYRVGLNWAISVLRTRRRRSERPLFVEASVELPEVVEPALLAALAKLEVGQRAVVICRFLLDWSVVDTAEALGVREGTVKSRLHRALTELRTELKHLAPEVQR